MGHRSGYYLINEAHLTQAGQAEPEKVAVFLLRTPPGRTVGQKKSESGYMINLGAAGNGVNTVAPNRQSTTYGQVQVIRYNRYRATLLVQTFFQIMPASFRADLHLIRHPGSLNSAESLKFSIRIPPSDRV